MWKYCRRKVWDKISRLVSIKSAENAHYIFTGKPEILGGEICLAKKAQANQRKPLKTAVHQIET